MNIIGGEMDHHTVDVHTYFTDSGRSSLRLILRSGFRDKKFLLPDFLCKVIPYVLDEFKVDYEYYRVKPDFSVDLDDIQKHKYDVLYLINYFGKKQNINPEILPERTWFLEDCVFLPIVEPSIKTQNWIGFNSFRKTSWLADGSVIKSRILLDQNYINRSDAPFAGLKYEAKEIKYQFLHAGRYSEKQYLDLFDEAEQLVDKQTEIFTISAQSQAYLLDFCRKIDQEYAIRKRNYEVLDDQLNHFKVELNAEYYTLYVLDVDRRDALRNYLFTKNIFLPVHWPALAGLDNSLYERIISIPVDSRYNRSDLLRVSDLIMKFYN